MNVADYLVRWSPNIVEATAEDIARFGPNAAQVRGLLNFAPTVGDDAAMVAVRAYDQTPGDRFKSRALAIEKAFLNNRMREQDIYSDFNFANLGDTFRDALRAETISDLITPETYRYFTNPLATAMAYQRGLGLILPDAQSRFMRISRDLRPTLPEEVVAIQSLSSNPNADAIVQMLGGMAEGQPLTRRIKAAETMYRVGREGRRGIV